MKKNPTSFGPERRPATSPSPVRKSVLILTSIVGLIAVALVVIALKQGKPEGHSANPAEDGPAPKSSGTGETVLDPLSDSNRFRISSQPDRLTVATPSDPDPSAIARQLIKSL